MISSFTVKKSPSQRRRRDSIRKKLGNNPLYKESLRDFLGGKEREGRLSYGRVILKKMRMDTFQLGQIDHSNNIIEANLKV